MRERLYCLLFLLLLGCTHGFTTTIAQPKQRHPFVVNVVPLNYETLGDVVEEVIKVGQGGDILNLAATAQNLKAGMIGGTVGVVGTVLAIELKMKEVKAISECPYCRGTGQLVCMQCLGAGQLMITNGEESMNIICPVCEGRTSNTCVNCHGDGRGVPNFLNKKTSRDPESELEELGMG